MMETLWFEAFSILIIVLFKYMYPLCIFISGINCVSWEKTEKEVIILQFSLEELEGGDHRDSKHSCISYNFPIRIY